MNIGLFCASSNKMDEIYYQQAAKLGAWMAENGHRLVFGGANCGLMDAAAKAVVEHGGQTLGIVPQILIDRNRVSDHLTTIHVTEELSERKNQLIVQSDVIIAMPGSVGTLDEVFTVMAANTIGIHSKRILFWNINGFWDELFVLLDSLKDKGVVNKPMDQLYSVASTLDELTRLISDIEATK